MRLSTLQKYILKQCYSEKKKLNRAKLVNFYSNGRQLPKKEDQINVITKSLERLIDKGLLVGYGLRTPQKWFIKDLRLTRSGLKIAKEVMGKQQKLKI